ncbi:MAG: 16S rRNA (cytidine(1402)-2'-O)-methyltransferase [Zoogloeaceae bacterium]|nr:16S rRNA (cytidine(1402)-2'-O)-methyltransferase [Rhodocyclaceae bacterium]MCP5235241.1 16S rRNA (cytidine(1402)-2'-O)-methyltransferase [Zoogloeaceae bacterium]
MSTSRPVLNKTASLYVVATPLGNLRDIGLRALDVLAEVAVVAAEDTRHTRVLLDAHGIDKRLIAAHEHNEREAAEKICALLARGESVALVSDAGTPAISDPGARIVRAVQQAGHPVVPVPGPCALAAALSASGLGDGRFLFQGFLPAKPAARRAMLEGLRDLVATLVFYEAPHRVRETVGDLLAVFDGERELVVCRELTKLFEEICRMPLAQAPAWFEADANRARGEFVLLVSAPVPQPGLSAQSERILRALLEELPVKSAARLASEITGVGRNALYRRALELRDAS